MPQDQLLAQRYRRAWKRVAETNRSYDRQPYYEIFRSASGRDLLPGADRGIELLNHPVGARAAEIIRWRGRELLERSGASGIAVSLRFVDDEVREDEPCITFFVGDAAAGPPIPPEIDGVPTDVVEAGFPGLQTGPTHHPGLKVRPAEPGCSIGHTRVSSGTFGCLVKDDAGVLYVLSCAHVLADAMAKPGDTIVQPGTVHGGVPTYDAIAQFTRALPLAPGPCDGDAAIAEVLDPSLVTGTIRYIGVQPSVTRALTAVGIAVQKSGDETGLTDGYVVGLNGLIPMYSALGISNIDFQNTIITTGMSLPGDSGSLLLDNQGSAVGLLFGGFHRARVGLPAERLASWHTPIDVVLTQLGVSLA